MDLRRVVRDAHFDDFAVAIFGSLPRADEFLAVIEFALAREPNLDVFPAVLERTIRGTVRAYKTRPTKEMKGLVVLFTHEEGTVYLLAVGHEQPSEGN
jgi:hypothetical protein